MNGPAKTPIDLDALLREPRRRPRKGFRFSFAPVVLGLAMAMAVLLLAQLLPRVWETVLPGGLDQASRLQGLPGLLFRAGYWAFRNQMRLLQAIAIGSLTLALTCRMIPGLRWLIWIVAALFVAINFGILAVTLQVATQVVMRG